jgi:hypothetical protein
MLLFHFYRKGKKSQGEYGQGTVPVYENRAMKPIEMFSVGRATLPKHNVCTAVMPRQMDT